MDDERTETSSGMRVERESTRERRKERGERESAIDFPNSEQEEKSSVEEFIDQFHLLRVESSHLSLIQDTFRDQSLRGTDHLSGTSYHMRRLNESMSSIPLIFTII